MAGLNPIGLGVLPQSLSPGGGTYTLAARRSTAFEGASFSPGNASEGAENPGVIIRISQEGLAASRQLGAQKEQEPGSSELSEEEQREVEQLKQRDREVRQHEQAHVAAGGKYVRGGASYQFTQGPDGRQYATGGEVSIDVGPERTPEATITKARIVKRAALAPAEPSAQDRQVAAAAGQLEIQARKELSKRRADNTERSESGSALDRVSASAGAMTLKIDQRV